MTHYRSDQVLQAPPAAVYAALTTTYGLRGWWTQDCEVADAEGGVVQIAFGATRKTLRIERLAPMREVRWRCTHAYIEAPGIARAHEWVGTTIVFRLSPEGADATRLAFEHVGLEPSLECHAMCIAAWDHFLASLRRFVETGRGMPHVRPAAAPRALAVAS